MIEYLGSLQIVFLVIGTAGYQMPLITFGNSQSRLRIQLHTIEPPKVRTVVHPPLPADGINHNTGVDGIHGSCIVRLHHTTHLVPRAFGRFRLCQTDVGCAASKSRHTIIKPIKIAIRDDVRSPDVRSTFTSGATMHPLHRLLRYLGKCPSPEVPMHQILGAAHLYISQGHTFFLSLLTVFPENGIRGIHIVIIAKFPTRRVVNIISTP